MLILNNYFNNLTRREKDIITFLTAMNNYRIKYSSFRNTLGRMGVEDESFFKKLNKMGLKKDGLEYINIKFGPSRYLPHDLLIIGKNKIKQVPKKIHGSYSSKVSSVVASLYFLILHETEEDYFSIYTNDFNFQEIPKMTTYDVKMIENFCKKNNIYHFFLHLVLYYIEYSVNLPLIPERNLYDNINENELCVATYYERFYNEYGYTFGSTKIFSMDKLKSKNVITLYKYKNKFKIIPYSDSIHNFFENIGRKKLAIDFFDLVKRRTLNLLLYENITNSKTNDILI